MTGHWEYDREWFYDKDAMWEYIRDNDYLDDIDFERWINRKYSAAQIFSCFGDALDERRPNAAEAVWYDIYDEFLDDYYGTEEPIEGEDFEFCDLTFKWVEDEEEEDE